MVDSPLPQSKSDRPFAWLWVVTGLLLFCGVIAYLVHLGHQQSIAEIQHAQQHRESESFEAVKGGKSEVTVYQSPEILSMLADDPDCVRNLRSVCFFICELGDPRFFKLSKLTNVREIAIYDGRGVEAFLKAIGGMPSIERISFESIRLDDEMLEQLAAFPNLKRVHFERDLDPSQIELLQRVIPNVEIEMVNTLGETEQIQTGAP